MEWSTYMFVKTALKGLQWASKEVVEQGVPTLLDDDDDDDDEEGDTRVLGAFSWASVHNLGHGLLETVLYSYGHICSLS